MGFKLINMKHFVILLLLILFSCDSQKKVINNSDEEEFVLAYKKAILYGCIDEATQSNFTEFSKTNKDLGIAIELEILQHSETLKALNDGKIYSQKIRSIEYEDFENKKPIYSDCVSFAFSRSSDSIARKLYRLKENNK
jgi:hypothetical protein